MLTDLAEVTPILEHIIKLNQTKIENMKFKIEPKRIRTLQEEVEKTYHGEEFGKDIKEGIDEVRLMYERENVKKILVKNPYAYYSFDLDPENIVFFMNPKVCKDEHFVQWAESVHLPERVLNDIKKD